MADTQFLEQTSLFRGVTALQAEPLQAEAREYSFRAGDGILRQGEASDTIFVVESGRVELTVGLNVLGVERQIAIEELSAGQTLAWSTMVEPYTLTLSARAMTEVKLLGFSRAGLIKLFDQRPDLGYRVMSNLLSVVGRRLHVTKALWLREVQRGVSAKYR